MIVAKYIPVHDQQVITKYLYLYTTNMGYDHSRNKEYLYLYTTNMDCGHNHKKEYLYLYTTNMDCGHSHNKVPIPVHDQHELWT